MEKDKIIYPYLLDFMRKTRRERDGILGEIERNARKEEYPISEPETADLIDIICRIKKPRRILEIGTGIGFSALLMKEACGGKILKVIIETCLLTDDEKKEMCRVVTESGADFIKTSTGFSKGGATREDIALFAANIGPNIRMKAAGGIRSFEDAEDFLALGCDRLGTSAIVKLAKKQTVSGY